MIGFLLPCFRSKGEEGEEKNAYQKQRMEKGQHLPNFVIKHCLFRIASWIGELSNQKVKKKKKKQKQKIKNKQTKKEVKGLLIISSSHDDKLRWVTNSNIGRGFLVCLNFFFS